MSLTQPVAFAASPPPRGSGKQNRQQWIVYFVARLDGVPPRLRDMTQLLRTAGHVVSTSAVQKDYVSLGIATGPLRPVLNYAARVGLIPRSVAAPIFPTDRQIAAAYAAAAAAARHSHLSRPNP
jgi:hypothetical protein